ncbi:dynein axonemal heavy chain 2-like [Paramisgurnus dabryanus]|uniref:dynein axonemal heavy chain 2-like n=1 Tax=Paramisgurnus dabryanus TaxID=90735 RepID=UPI0031F361C9
MADPWTPHSDSSSSSMSKQSISGEGHSKSKHTSSTPAPSDLSLEVPEIAVEEMERKPASQVPISDTPEEADSYTKRLKETFKKHLALSGISKESWTDENERALDKFISDPSIRLLIVYHDPFTSPRVDYAMPAQVVEQMSYFIRAEDSVITEESFESSVQFGSIKGGAIEGLLRFMNGIHAPQVTLSTTWPESTKNFYTENLHRFITNITDSRFKLLGSTVLYVPLEALQHRPEEVIQNKNLVHRLEMVIIHWTRQIKEVLSAQEIGEMGDSSGPLEEISFWKSRFADLANISQQLQKPGVRHMLKILQLCSPFYTSQFSELAKHIQDFSLQAQSNISFLSLLKEPCEELAQLKPCDIAPKLPHIIKLIRVIWVNSSYYNTRERITALFGKMSNEIIRLCRREISLDRIFQGYVISSKQILNECIQCCLAWKEIYLHTSQLHHKHSSQGWLLSETSIFALVEAFVQRCKDLIEVCECQQQFARREEGEQAQLPCFAGRQGLEVTQNLLNIEATFEKNLQVLGSVKDILDVRNTSWHDGYTRFRSEVKDLEVMMQNLISSAFETVKSVEEGVQLLDVFKHLSEREAIKRTIDTKMVDVYNLFNDELSLVNKVLCRISSLTPAEMPQYAGQAHLARALHTQIERPMEVLQNANFLPDVSGKEGVHVAYAQLCRNLDEKVRRIFTDWSQSLDRQCLGGLNQPLMIRCQEKTGLLDVNFNKNLLKMINEIHYWDRLQFEIPHYVTEVHQRREELLNLKENVLLVVKDYNRIITALNAEEMGLFSERIRFLNKKFQPGLTKLHWSTKGTANVFINDCRVHANKVQLMVDEYKVANLAVSKFCAEISDLLLVRVDGKIVYGDLEFQEDQKKHQHSQLLRLQAAHQEMVNILAKVYMTFQTDGTEVQQHWVSYVEKVDCMVQEAFRTNVKRSLQDLSKAINGDGKTPPNPLFRVEVVLKQRTPGSTAQVDFSPSLPKLAQMVNSISAQLIHTISGFKRLPELLTNQNLQKKPIHRIIAAHPRRGIAAVQQEGPTAHVLLGLQQHTLATA